VVSFIPWLWLELTGISRASFKQVLALALKTELFRRFMNTGAQ
jgi:hypothetical protein